jgi:tetratricopeptide (TPR) repeat protein
VSARGRVYAIVAACAIGAAAAVVGMTAALHEDVPAPLGPREGSPPFAADPTQPPELVRAVRTAVAAWPEGTLPRLRGIVEEAPRSAFVRLNLGLALYWGRNDAAAAREWQTASRVQPDTPSAVRAQDLLHPRSPPGLPFFVPAGEVSPALRRGLTLQRAGRPVSAERAFASAARAAPDDPEAQVAAAVARFRKDTPERGFGALGPLARRFPREQTVRFHLGLLSIWINDFRQARRQFRLAVALNPDSRLAMEANRLLDSLLKAGTG